MMPRTAPPRKLRNISSSGVNTQPLLMSWTSVKAILAVQRLYITVVVRRAVLDNSSSAVVDALRQGGIHWVMSFYDPRERRWVKRLDSL